ncbi:MAG TPA: hypothetical protein PKD83_13900 [Ignavibacteria bacterium]|nr:hypothetical protein [Ignavibacteria bacterium]
MADSQLIKFLKSLNSVEIRQFRDFINSPAFNKNQNISRLFEIHLEYYPVFENENLEDEKIYGIIFGNEKFQYFKHKNLISDLFALGKEFLVFNVYRKDSQYKEKYLLQELRLRNLDLAFEKTYKHALKQLEKNQLKDENYFRHKLALVYEITSFNAPKNPNDNLHYLQEQLDDFVFYSIITLLKYYEIMLHENNQNNFKYDMKMFDYVMKFLESYDSTDNPTLEMYYYIILLENTKDEKYFYKLKELKNKYRNQLDSFNNYMIYLHLDGFCATAFNKHSRTDLLKEQFLLAKENSMIDTNEFRKVLYPDFLNEVKKAVRVNEFEWAEDYIERLKEKLTDERENTLNFCYAYIAHKKGEYDKALELFSRVNFSNFILKIQVKIHLLQIFFDKKYYDDALLMIDTFRRYLAREKSILESTKISVLEFLKITGELVKINSDIRSNDNDFKINGLKEDIEKMQSNTFGIKLWLRDKINSTGG